MKKSLILSASLIGLTTGFTALSTPAEAQVAEDEIIVTATRRAESMFFLKT